MYIQVLMFCCCANFFWCLNQQTPKEFFLCAKKVARAPLSIHLCIPFICKRCNFVLLNVVSVSVGVAAQG